MLDAAEWTELAVFQRQYNNLTCEYSNYEDLHYREQTILQYFEDRIKFLQEKKET
jgi:hypothetical protein